MVLSGGSRPPATAGPVLAMPDGLISRVVLVRRLIEVGPRTIRRAESDKHTHVSTGGRLQPY